MTSTAAGDDSPPPPLPLSTAASSQRATADAYERRAAADDVPEPPRLLLQPLIAPQPTTPAPSNASAATLNYAGLRIDAALRNFLEHVALAGESTDRARILALFADRYAEANPTLFDNTGKRPTVSMTASGLF